MVVNFTVGADGAFTVAGTYRVLERDDADARTDGDRRRCRADR